MRTICKLLGAAIAVATGLTAIDASADSKVTTFVRGEDTGKELTRLTFNGQTVTLVFNDNTTRDADMSEVKVLIDHNTSAIENICADPAKATGVYNIRGQYLGETPEGLSTGIYIVNGQKIAIK